MGLKIAHFPNSPGADELRKEDESRGGGRFLHLYWQYQSNYDD